MINLPSSLNKGETLTFALNKALVTAATSDSYWSDSANIQKCIVVYKSTSGRQRKKLEFDFTQESPTTNAEWSAKARNAFEIEEIVLIDFDGGSYVIPRSSLPSGKGISFGGEGGGGGGSIVTQVVHNYIPNGAVNDMVTDGSNVWIGGAFTALRFMAPNAATISATTGENALTDQVSGKFPIFNGAIRCFAYDGPDTLFVGGDFTTIDGVTRNRIAKLNRVNDVWVSDSAFNIASTRNGLNNGVYKILVDGNNLYPVGYFTIYIGPDGVSTTRPSIVKLDKNSGQIDTGFNAGCPSTSGQGLNAAVISGDYIYIAGRQSTGGASSGYHIGKQHKLTGARSSGWPDILHNQTGVAFNSYVYDLAVHGGHVYVAGQFLGTYVAIGGVSYPTKFNLFKMSEDGVMDTAFQAPWTTSSTTNFVSTIVFDENNNLVAGGQFKAVNNACQNLIKLNASTGSVFSGTANQNGSGSGSARSLRVLGSINEPIFGGNENATTSDSYSYTVQNGVMTLTYSYRTMVSTSINGGGSGYYEIPLPAGWDFAPSVERASNLATTIVSTGLGSLLGNGTFENSSSIPMDVHAGPRGLMLRILFGSETRWWSSAFGATNTNARLTIEFTSSIPVVKTFAPAGEVLIGKIEKLIKNNNALFAVGSFSGIYSNANSSLRNTVPIVKLNLSSGTSETAFSSETQKLMSGELVRDAVIDGSNLIVGGSFNGWGGYYRQGAAKLNKDSYGNWKVDETFNTSSGGTAVNTLALSGNDLYIGGTFITWAGSSRLRVAKLNATTGALDGVFGVGVFTSGQTTGQFNGVTNTVNKVLVDGGDLVIAGAFTTYSKRTSTSGLTNTATPYWIRVNTETNTESVPTFGPNVAFSALDVSGDFIYAGGAFTTWGGVSCVYAAKVNKITGALEVGFAPSFSSGAIALVKATPSGVFFGTGSGTINGVSGSLPNTSAGCAFINPDNGSTVKQYFKPSIHMIVNRIVENSTHYFVFGTSGGNGSALAKIAKSDLEITNIFNSGNASNGYSSLGGLALVGDDLILGYTGTSPYLLTPSNKYLFSIKLSDASQNSNI